MKKDQMSTLGEVPAEAEPAEPPKQTAIELAAANGYEVVSMCVDCTFCTMPISIELTGPDKSKVWAIGKYQRDAHAACRASRSAFEALHRRVSEMLVRESEMSAALERLQQKRDETIKSRIRRRVARTLVSIIRHTEQWARDSKHD